MSQHAPHEIDSFSWFKHVEIFLFCVCDHLKLHNIKIPQRKEYADSKGWLGMRDVISKDIHEIILSRLLYGTVIPSYQYKWNIIISKLTNTSNKTWNKIISRLLSFYLTKQNNPYKVKENKITYCLLNTIDVNSFRTSGFAWTKSTRSNINKHRNSHLFSNPMNT